MSATATYTGAEPAAASEDDRSMTGARGGIAGARRRGAAAAEAKDAVAAEKVGAAAGVVMRFVPYYPQVRIFFVYAQISLIDAL